MTSKDESKKADESKTDQGKDASEPKRRGPKPEEDAAGLEAAVRGGTSGGR